MAQGDEYIKLVSDVKKYYESDNIRGGCYTKINPGTKQKEHKDFYLRWCPECKEINLWTYWQGKKNRQAEILLLGQDWATAWEEDSNGKLLEYMSRILDGDSGFSERYIKEICKGSSPTDQMLSKMMRRLGDKYNPYIPDNDRLFFTNLCLGYRDHGVSGGLSKRALKHDVIYIEKLIEIVKPKIIICLGKDTYEAFIAKAKCVPVVKEKSFYKNLAEGNCYAWYKNEIPIFGQAHTGTFGRLNRWRYNPAKIAYHDGICEELLAQDWDVIKRFLK